MAIVGRNASGVTEVSRCLATGLKVQTTCSVALGMKVLPYTMSRNPWIINKGVGAYLFRRRMGGTGRWYSWFIRSTSRGGEPPELTANTHLSLRGWHAYHNPFSTIQAPAKPASNISMHLLPNNYPISSTQTTFTTRIFAFGGVNQYSYWYYVYDEGTLPQVGA